MCKAETEADVIDLDQPIDFADVCRDETCSRMEVHRSHRISKKTRETRGSFHVSRHDVIVEAVFAAVSAHFLKPFKTIYDDVINDYGSIKDRSVYRALDELVAARRVVTIVPFGMNDVVRRNGHVRGGFIRYDSALLWRPGGLFLLQEQADELCEQMSGFIGGVARAKRRRVSRRGVPPHMGLYRSASDRFVPMG